MSALRDDYQRDRWPRGPHLYPVDIAALLYAGALTVTNADGELEAGGDRAGVKFAGVNYGERVNGNLGGQTCIVDKEQEFVASGTGFTAGDVGRKVYLVDDTTVALTTTHLVLCGVISAFISSTEVRVDPSKGDTDLAVGSVEVAVPTTPGNVDGEIAGVSIAGVTPALAVTPTNTTAYGYNSANEFNAAQSALNAAATVTSVEALRTKCEELGDDLRTTVTELTALRAGMVTLGLVTDPD